MVRILHCTKGGSCQDNVRPEQLAELLNDDYGLLWMDLADEPAEHCDSLLRELFGFHPLAVDDALNESHAPKIDDWGNYLYVVLHDVRYDPGRNPSMELPELDIFVGQPYLVTYHTETIEAVERVWQTCQRDDRLLKHGSDHLLYRIADELAVDYTRVVDTMEEEMDKIEDRIFSNPTPDILERIFDLKRPVLHLRRTIGQQREVLNKLARDDYAVIDPKDQIYFRDVYDHLIRLYDIVEGMRDLVGGALDTYLSVVNNRMNDIMKTLTIITTLFMPLSFLTGFFGMNFFGPVIALPFWTGRFMFMLLMLSMVSLPFLMFWWMRRRSWM